MLTNGQDAKWNHDKVSEIDSVFREALTYFIIEMDSSFGKVTKSEETKILFLEYQNYLRNIPNFISGYEIHPVGPGNYQGVFKQNKNRLPLIKVSPLTLEDGSFKITFTLCNAHLEGKKSLNLALSHWIIIYFNFKDGHLVYQKTEKGGI